MPPKKSKKLLPIKKLLPVEARRNIASFLPYEVEIVGPNYKDMLIATHREYKHKKERNERTQADPTKPDWWKRVDQREADKARLEYKTDARFFKEHINSTVDRMKRDAEDYHKWLWDDQTELNIEPTFANLDFYPLDKMGIDPKTLNPVI
jgi:hypothetical protein